MSKIYEALRQAEQDRAQAEKQSVPGPSTSTHATTSEAAAAQVSAEIPPQQPAPFAPVIIPPAPAKAVAREPLEATPPSTFQPAQANVQVWHPDLAKMPSVQARGAQVEQFRTLRSKLFEFRDLNKLKTLLISSGRPAEGKSFVALNLAITFARHKSARVLLIDGDMRRSSLHNLLGCPSEPGLAEYLSNRATLGEIMQRGRMEDEATPLPAGLPFLTFIPAGNGGDKAADLSGSARFQGLIEEVSPHFDWIVVDSSPVNLVTDGVNLARALDGVLLIARGGITKFETAQRAITELKASKILGLVLNAVQDAPSADAYYGYESESSAKE